MNNEDEITEQTPTPEDRYTPPLMKVSGQDYVRVADRVVWFRNEHPDGVLETDLIEHERGQYALVKCVVANGNGGMATGYGSETFSDFKDYLEKAEAKAIGRALGNLGYGTASALKDDGIDAGRPVDTPVDRRNSNMVAARGPGNPANANLTNPNRSATDNQRRFITGLARDLHLSDADLEAEIENVYGGTLATITAGDAHALIESLKQRKAEGWHPMEVRVSSAPPDDTIPESADAEERPASFSKMPWDDIVTELRLTSNVADQLLHWKNELKVLSDDSSDTEKRANIKAFCMLAADAVTLKGQTQAWRFVEVIDAIPLELSSVIDSVVKAADRVGVGRDKRIQDAAVGRTQRV